MLLRQTLDHLQHQFSWQGTIGERGRAAAGDRPQVRSRPGKAVEFVGDDPRFLVIKAKAAFGFRRQFDTLPKVARRYVADWRDGYDVDAVCLLHSKHHDAWPVLDAFLSPSACFVPPEVGIADDQARDRFRKGHRLSLYSARVVLRDHALGVDFVVELSKGFRDHSVTDRGHILVA
jgi:hypothetical protein